MVSGPHAHVCPTCGALWDCPQMTHCRCPERSSCYDCDDPGSPEPYEED